MKSLESEITKEMNIFKKRHDIESYLAESVAMDNIPDDDAEPPSKGTVSDLARIIGDVYDDADREDRALLVDQILQDTFYDAESNFLVEHTDLDLEQCLFNNTPEGHCVIWDTGGTKSMDSNRDHFVEYYPLKTEIGMQFFKGGASIRHFGLKRSYVWLASKKSIAVFYVAALHLPSDRSISIDSDSQLSRQGLGFVNLPSHGLGQFPYVRAYRDNKTRPPSLPTSLEGLSREGVNQPNGLPTYTNLSEDYVKSLDLPIVSMLSGAPITSDEDKRLRHIARMTLAKDTPQERFAYSIDSTEDASSSYDGASLYASKSTSSASSLPLYPFVVAIITVFVICSGLFTDSLLSSEITAAGRTIGTPGIKIVGFCEENPYLRERSRRLAPDALVFTDLATLPRDLEASDLQLGDVDVVFTSTRCRARSISANTDPLWRARPGRPLPCRPRRRPCTFTSASGLRTRPGPIPNSPRRHHRPGDSRVLPLRHGLRHGLDQD